MKSSSTANNTPADYNIYSRPDDVRSNARYSNLKILVVDDEITICIPVCELLEMLGYQASYATNPDEGLKILEENPQTDIVLLDINLGTSMSGIDLLPLIKEKNKYVQVVMFTSNDTLDAGLDAMKHGACDYLTKPFSEEDFQKVVPFALEKKRAAQLNDLFLGILVHDLKNPLQCINGSEELLRETLKHMLDGNQKKMLAIMRKSIMQINNMINNILFVEKFENEKLHINLERFPLKDEIEAINVFFENEILLSSKRFVINNGLEESFKLTTDRQIFSKVLINIAGNALRFSSDGEDVTIDFKNIGEDFIQTSITNRGSYIEENHRDVIFDKFSSVKPESKSAGTQNYGLGLTFSKIAVESLGGKIWIEGRKEIPETTFHFTIKNHKDV